MRQHKIVWPSIIESVGDVPIPVGSFCGIPGIEIEEGTKKGGKGGDRRVKLWGVPITLIIVAALLMLIMHNEDRLYPESHHKGAWMPIEFVYDWMTTSLSEACVKHKLEMRVETTIEIVYRVIDYALRMGVTEDEIHYATKTLAAEQAAMVRG